MADFENYKKRTEKEFADLISNANTNLIKDILHIVDELELSLKASKENTDYDSFYEGVNLIYTKFLDLLKQKGLKPIVKRVITTKEINILYLTCELFMIFVIFFVNCITYLHTIK